MANSGASTVDVKPVVARLHGLAHQRAVSPAFRRPPDIAERLVTALAHLTGESGTAA